MLYSHIGSDNLWTSPLDDPSNNLCSATFVVDEIEEVRTFVLVPQESCIREQQFVGCTHEKYAKILCQEVFLQQSPHIAILYFLIVLGFAPYEAFLKKKKIEKKNNL